MFDQFIPGGTDVRLSIPAECSAEPPLYAAFLGACFDHTRTQSWPSVHMPIPDDVQASRVSDNGYEYVTRIDPGSIWVRFYGGSARVDVAAGSPQEAQELLLIAAQLQPEAQPAKDTIGVNFWTGGPHGASSRYREILAPRWDEIRDNYPSSVADAVGPLVAPNFRPGTHGKLALVSGPPGGGKTYFVRALCREHQDSCGVHYIVDPENFFGDMPQYMMEVLLGEWGPEDADKWRLLILEDTGELLQRDAHERTGQGLSRFLNVVDGMIGQGLKLLALLTTNEEVKELHPAVARPGRCIADVEFTRFSADEADGWLVRHAADPLARSMSLAELYACLDGRHGGRSRSPMGFSGAT